ncbi:tyrosine phosphatase-like protein [Scheffersomyces coipomensis]|uniref:tyrosine phosphatase-like protein n=1 Tax=Scheffersomyces coipomensis TaxID=1788519 RepID=UPI00315DAE72
MSRLSKSYLIAYNGISAVLWLAILQTSMWDIIAVKIYHDSSNYYISHQFEGDFPHKLLVYTQLFNSIMEIIHSLTGIVKSPIPTLIVQAAARSLITLGINYTLPQSPGNYHFVFFNMIIWAWSTSDIIRYIFFSFKLLYTNSQPPYWLIWLRYSAFLMLYPIGLISESSVVYLSLSVVTKNTAYYYFLLFGLSSYLPGLYFLYGYMLKQRKKVLSKKNN